MWHCVAPLPKLKKVLKEEPKAIPTPDSFKVVVRAKSVPESHLPSLKRLMPESVPECLSPIWSESGEAEESLRGKLI